MIVLDTNIISEMMKAAPSIKVRAWLDEQEVTELFITSITIAEITYGLNCLPQGKRKAHLTAAFNKTVKEGFQHRILHFDDVSAYECGKIMSYKKEMGKPMSFQDAQIVAITYSQGGALTTRNIKDFSDCNVELINPFI